MDAARRGDYLWEKGVTHLPCRVACPIFVNLLLCPLRKHEVDVRMTQNAILRGIISAAVEVVHPRNIKAYPATPIHLHQGDVYNYIGERLKLEGETENMGVCTK